MKIEHDCVLGTGTNNPPYHTCDGCLFDEMTAEIDRLCVERTRMIEAARHAVDVLLTTCTNFNGEHDICDWCEAAVPLRDLLAEIDREVEA